MNILKINAVSSPSSSTQCVIPNAHVAFAGVIATLSCDAILMFSVLWGLFRRRPAYSYGIWGVLWNQGLIWTTLVTIAEVPTVVLFCLNLDPVINLAPSPPEVVIIAVGATRLYRSLHDYSRDYSRDYVPSNIPSRNYKKPWRTLRSRSNVTIQVDVHRMVELNKESR